KSRIEFDRVIGFGEREFGYGSVELKLQALQENGMIDAAFGAAPAENAVTENELNALGFAVDAAIEGVQSFKDFHRGTSGLFGLGPFFACRPPALPSGQPGWVIGKIGGAGFSVLVGLIPGNSDGRLVGWVVPTGFEPRSDRGGGLGRRSQRRALSLQNESAGAGVVILRVRGFVFRGGGFGGS